MGGDFFVSQVAPIGGVIITELLHFGPMYAVLEARRNGRLGSLDPVLFSMTLPQAVVWVVYGTLINNTYYVLGSIGGIFIGIFYLMTSMQLVPSKSQCRKMEVFMLAQIAIITVIAILGLFEKEVAGQAAGLASMVSSISLYATPFLNLRTMIVNKDASSINRGFLFMQLVSGVMWTSYAMFDFDVWVLLPSIMGLTFGLVQLGLVVLYWKRRPAVAGDQNQADVPLTSAIDTCYRPPICYRRSKSSDSFTAEGTAVANPAEGEGAPAQVPTSSLEAPKSESQYFYNGDGLEIQVLDHVAAPAVQGGEVRTPVPQELEQPQEQQPEQELYIAPVEPAYAGSPMAAASTHLDLA